LEPIDALGINVVVPQVLIVAEGLGGGLGFGGKILPRRILVVDRAATVGCIIGRSGSCSDFFVAVGAIRSRSRSCSAQKNVVAVVALDFGGRFASVPFFFGVP